MSDRLAEIKKRTVENISSSDLDWLIAEVERLKTELDRAWREVLGWKEGGKDMTDIPSDYQRKLAEVVLSVIGFTSREDHDAIAAALAAEGVVDPEAHRYWTQLESDQHRKIAELEQQLAAIRAKIKT